MFIRFANGQKPLVSNTNFKKYVFLQVKLLTGMVLTLITACITAAKQILILFKITCWNSTDHYLMHDTSIDSNWYFEEKNGQSCNSILIALFIFILIN